MSNHTVLDLNAVAYADSYWRNQHGQTRRLKPTLPTAHGSPFDPDEYASYHPDYPKETMIERARRLEILDVWTFVERFQLRNSHSLHYTGEKGKNMQAAWNQKLFKKQRKH